MAAYDSDNVFAKILRGEIPSERVYEDAKTIAIMDIMPRADGHVLVLPKNPSRNILDIPDDDLIATVLAVRKLSQAVKAAFAADGVTVQQFSEPAGGQMVFHTHFHVMPRHRGVDLKPPGGQMADPKVLAANAAKIRSALASRQ
jgi:histidine triad (HIT) family protein